MFQYGMTQWIVGDEPFETSFSRLRKCGYDSIEFAGEPGKLNVQECKALMQQYGLRCDSLCGIFTPQRDLSSAGEAADRAIAYLKDCVDFGAALGASVLIVVPSPVGRTQAPEDISFEQLWNNAVRNIRSAADYAQAKGMRFAIEAINRYETYFVNTMDKACRMADDISHPAVGVMADTFHMNLEENDMVESLKKAVGKLMHVHLADNTREPAGMGTIDFASVLHTLKEIDYQGILCMEFLPRVSDPYAGMKSDNQSQLMDKYAKYALDYMKGVEKAVFSK